ncbi:MAG: polysaccharide biosynthesis tyrosine autokinase [Kiritimatiellae bacterium]|nr:polysaccharide biosynthesis tyrosine autokinase [Kiritimatiellia bacterium]
MTTDETNQETEGLHLLDYLAVVRQRMPLAIGVFLAVALLTVLYTWTRTPRFTAVSRLLIEARGVNLTATQDAFDPGRANLAQRDLIQTQVQLITSVPVLESALETGILADNPDFAQARDPVRKLGKMIKVLPASTGYVLDVSVTSENPVEAAKVVNAVVDAYIAASRARRLGVSDDGIAELKKKAADLNARLNAESAELQAFMTSNRMVSFEDAQNIVVDRLKGLNKNLMAAEPVRMAAQSRYEAAAAALSSGASVESIPGVLENSLVTSLKIELSKLEQQYSECKDRLGPQHTQIQSLTAQMESLRTKIALEAANIVAGLKTKYEQALEEENMLRAELARQEEEVLHFNELADRYNLLRQSRDSAREAYTSIIRRIDELDVSRLSGQGDNVFIVARAEVPQEKSWPSRGKMLLIGLFFGALLAVGACFFFDYMDTTIKNDADVRTYLAQSLLGSIPSATREAEENDETFDDFFALRHPRGHFAEAFRTARTALAFTAADKPLKSFAVTSTLASEGKSLTAVNLALAYAQAGKKTLVVDCDLRKPRLAKLFPGCGKKGLSDFLTADGGDPVAAVFKTPVENLFFLPSGTVPPNPVELIDSERFSAVKEKLSESFDILVFDAPPALNMVDALVLGKQTDGLVLVTRAFVTSKFAARQLARQLAVANARVLGVLLNNVDTTAGDYYYGGYYNYYSYGVDSRDGRGGGNRPGFFERARRTLAGLGKRQTPSGKGQDRRRPRHG